MTDWFLAFRNWENFEHGLRFRNRFGTDRSAYLERMVESAMSLQTTLAADTRLYRARISPLSHSDSASALPPEVMGPPPAEQTPGGRVNPEGIPYLYAALSPEAAIAEVRPWKFAHISVATISISRELPLIDFRYDNTLKHQSEDIRWLSFVMSRPTHRDDRLAYIGTQFFAEELKRRGALGVVYPSQMSLGGTNVALFHPSVATVVSTEPYLVDEVNVRASKIPKPSGLSLLGLLNSHSTHGSGPSDG